MNLATEFYNSVQSLVCGKTAGSNEHNYYTPNTEAEWEKATLHVFIKWLSEGRYTDLIACAKEGILKNHGYFSALAEYFSAENEFGCLRLLCEEGIERAVASFIDSVSAAEKSGLIFPKDKNGDINDLKNAKKYDSEYLNRITETRLNSLILIENYIGYLKKNSFCDIRYFSLLNKLKNKTADFTVKKADIKLLVNYKPEYDYKKARIS